MNIVPTVTTPITEQEAFDSLVMAWKNQTGAPPSRQVASLLLALCWIETARGQKLRNFNPGNLIATANYSGDAWRPEWFEIDENSSPKNVELHAKMLLNPPKVPSAFRSYESLPKGFADWVKTLNAVFPEVVGAAKSGDPDSFRVALSKHYSTDYAKPEATASFASLQRSFMPLTVQGGLADDRPLVSSLPPAPSPSLPHYFSGPCALPVLGLGDRGQAVALWQVFLGGITINGIFDTGTLDATRNFQTRNKLVADGRVGPLTWGKLLP